MSTKARFEGDAVADLRLAGDPEAAGYSPVPVFVRLGHRLIDGVWCRADGSPLTADERRWFIAPRTLVLRLTNEQAGAVLSAILAGNVGVFRLLLELATTDRISSDGVAYTALAQLFGASERDRLLAPDPNAPS